MAIRQYIGARYVTKIYENSLDPSSAEWEAGVSYEPLTLVTYNNGSYLSKKEVPGAIGDPASNPSYWVQTGAYNGQIASLQAQIDTINNTTIPPMQNDINDLKAKANHYWLLVTDSYGDPVGVGSSYTWQKYFKDLMGLTEGTDCLSTHQNGAGFNPVFASPWYFTDVVTPGRCADGVPAAFDTSLITDIIVAGGANERGQTVANVETGIGNFMTYVFANYPNVRNVYIAGVGNSFNILSANDMNERQYLAAYKKCEKYGAHYLAGCENVLQNYSMYNQEIDPDNTYVEGHQLIHPNQSGSLEIAMGIINAMTGAYCVEYPYITGTFTKDVSWTAPATVKINLGQKLKGNCLALSWGSMTFTKGSAIAISNNQWIDLGSFTDDLGYLKPNTFPLEIPVIGFLAGGDFGTNTPFPMRLRFTNNKVQVSVSVGEPANTMYIAINGGGTTIELP